MILKVFSNLNDSMILSGLYSSDFPPEKLSRVNHGVLGHLLSSTLGLFGYLKPSGPCSKGIACSLSEHIDDNCFDIVDYLEPDSYSNRFPIRLGIFAVELEDAFKALHVAVQPGTRHKDAKQNSDDLGRLTGSLQREKPVVPHVLISKRTEEPLAENLREFHESSNRIIGTFINIAKMTSAHSYGLVHGKLEQQLHSFCQLEK
ncbi:hypothetical protein QYF61_017282 [Mycteria americana]|uniref:Uncharacterized protein n=1 Tax=Mycteria americana TaxID=33587 RepID=A0AAN7S3R4_MYCAM|nr:hypothetical protein QYF61_017282 [Mycteria americana]